MPFFGHLVLSFGIGTECSFYNEIDTPPILLRFSKKIDYLIQGHFIDLNVSRNLMISNLRPFFPEILIFIGETDYFNCIPGRVFQSRSG